MLHSKVDQVHIAYDDARKYVNKAKNIYLSGNPVREMISMKSRTEILTEFGFKDRLTISIIGGSLGAKTVNEAISKLCNQGLFIECNLIWQTGTLTFESFKQHQSKNCNIAPFYSNMNNVYSVSDIIICRAGAMTLAEIQNCGIPAIIVPYKYATGNHQYHNAKSLQDANAAYLIEDNDKLQSILKSALHKLIDHSDKRSEMSKKMLTFAKSEATKNIVDCVYKLIKNQ